MPTNRSAASRAAEISPRRLELASPDLNVLPASSALAASEFTGSCALTFPLPAASARDFAPELSLGYATSTGNGPFGLGFSLSMSSVSRLTRRNIPRYDADDVFVLDEPLVRVDAERVAIDGRTYEVVRYRRRRAENHDRIEQWTETQAGEPFWRVTTADDVTFVFGRTAQARIADPGNPARVFEWLLDYQYDARGNACAFRYKQENLENVAAAIYEHNRTQTANRYLARASYGNKRPFDPTRGLVPVPDLDWSFELVFDFGEYDFSAANPDPYAPRCAWSARPDPFSDYSAGFERRTHRLCRNVALFHRFAELGGVPQLTSVIALTYREGAELSALSRMRKVGYRRLPAAAGAAYATKAGPALDLAYLPFEPQNVRRSRLVDVVGMPLPNLADASAYTIVDLDGGGVPGVLRADDEMVRYWRPVATEDGLRYAASDPDAFPIDAREGGTYRLASLAGNGELELVVEDAGQKGFYRSEGAGAFGPFTPFAAVSSTIPGEPWEVVDIAGSGRSDRIRIGRGLATVLPSAGEAGYGEQYAVPCPIDLPITAAVPDPFETVVFANICGAAAIQRARIRDGSVECWPSLGYGAFGDVVRLGNAPRFAAEVPPPQVRLADIDGSGFADLIFVYPGRAEIYLNRSGNAFAPEPIVVSFDTRYRAPTQVTFADVFGSGTQCLIFSAYMPTPGQGRSQVCYDFTPRGKPHLLNAIDNNLGSRTFVDYRSAASFWLEDKNDGMPWVTSLPMAMQVVAEVRNEDAISGTTTATTYRYHHGCFDPVDKEFHGFGMVERFDTEHTVVARLRRALRQGMARRADASADMPADMAGPAFVAPAHTKTWFNVGILRDQAAVLARYAREYFAGDRLACPPPPDLMRVLPSAGPDALRQACAALTGRVIRTETYGLEGANAAIPYAVTQAASFAVQVAPAQGRNPDAAFMIGGREELEYSYERQSDDPLVQHSFTLRLDADGNIERTASVAYARRAAAAHDPHAFPEQFVTHVTCSVTGYVPRRDDPHYYLSGLPLESHDYELTGVAPPDLLGLYYSWTEIDKQVNGALDGASGAPTATVYAGLAYEWATDAHHEVAPQALLVAEASLAFTDALARDVLGAEPLPQPLDEFLHDTCGFAPDSATGLWWNPGSRQDYRDASGFFLPCRVRDVFSDGGGSRAGTTVTYAYDPYSLLLVSVTATPGGNDVLASTSIASAIDYAAMAVLRLTDANGVVSEILQDALGNVIAATSYGTEVVNGVPTRVGFAPFDFAAEWPEPASIAEVIADPPRFLRGAAAFYFVDPTSYERRAGPAGSITVTASTYPDVTPAGPIGLAISYSDGFGRTAQETRLAPPGDGIPCDRSGHPILAADGKPTIASLDERWLTSGRVLFNNKGEPFKAYEPFYIATPRFIPASELPPIGVSPTFYYDAVGRVVRVAQERGMFVEAFFSETEHRAWSRSAADENSTVLRSAYYRYYIDEGHALPPYERDALVKAAAVSGTRSHAVHDSLGNEIATIGELRSGTEATELVSRAGYDIAGRQLWQADPRLDAQGLRNVTRTFTLDGAMWKSVSVDAGTSVAVSDVFGNGVFIANSRGFVSLQTYDSMHRPVQVAVKGGDGRLPLDNVAHRLIYGDSLDASGAVPFPIAGGNARGQIVVAYDEAGRIESPLFSIRGMPLASNRQIRTDYLGEADWRGTAATWAQLFADLAPALDPTRYAAAFRYDGLGRPVLAIDADRNEQAAVYDVLGQLTTRTFRPAGGSAAHPFVKAASYTPRGQVERIVRGDQNGDDLAQSTYRYDPSTGRVINITTARPRMDDRLQDLTYYYDPAGNLTHVQDPQAPAARVFFANQAVTADNDFTYDSLDRLIIAKGRAIVGLTLADQVSGGFAPFFPSRARPSDARALEGYTLTYGYDRGDNLVRTTYQAASGGWTQEIEVAPGSNRGVEATSGARAAFPTDAFDGCGNPRKLSAIPSLAWNYANQLHAATIIDRGTPAASDLEAYQYAADANRVRRVTQRDTGGALTRIETLYLGSVEITRTFRGDTLIEEYHRARLEAGGTPMAERLEWRVGSPPAGVDSPQTRHQFANELGSVALEIDDRGQLVSYEEYAPFGATTFAAGASLVEVSLKQRRFSAKERDQATGLVYFGARYYAPWIGRWLNPDPVGTTDGLNLYRYVDNNPTRYIDAFGYGKKKTKTPLPAKSAQPSTMGSGRYPKRATTARANAKNVTRTTKKGSIYKKKSFEKTISYPKASIDKYAKALGKEARYWHDRATRPAIHKEVREKLAKQKAGANKFTRNYQKAKTPKLDELGINQDHKLAQSWIGSHLATIFDTYVKYGSFTSTQKDALKGWMSALHNDTGKGGAEYKALSTALKSGDENTQRAGLTTAYKSLAGKALGNFKFGSATLNQIIFNSADWHRENGSRTPRSQEIYDTTLALGAEDLIPQGAADASVEVAMYGKKIIDSSDFDMMLDIGDELLQANIAIPAETYVRGELNAANRPGY